MTPQYMVLEGLTYGNRFFTANSDKPEDEKVKLSNGTVAYKILGYADTPEDARAIIRKDDPRSDKEIMSDYLFRNGRNMFSKEECDRVAEMISEKE